MDIQRGHAKVSFPGPAAEPMPEFRADNKEVVKVRLVAEKLKP